jgi:hypothetical protein
MAVFGDARLTRALWPHQERALARVDLSREATYLVVPPGGGKTLTVLTYQAVCADSSIHQEGTALLCSLDDIAMATADALHTAGLAARGADSVRVEVLPDGGYRARYPPSPPRNPRLSPTRSMRCSHRSPSPGTSCRATLSSARQVPSAPSC